MDSIPPSRKKRRPRVCTDCGETDTAKFYVYPSGYIHPRCRKCQNAREVEREYQKHQQAEQWVQGQQPLFPRQKMPAIMYGNHTDKDIALLIAAQQGLCKICRQPLQKGKGKRNRIHVDHDHQTGEIRGILCHGCNMGIGFFHDDPPTLRRAADYLEAYYTGYLEVKGWTKQPRRERKGDQQNSPYQEPLLPPD